MDVILDANAFLSDIRFQNVPFQSLLEYLKRLKHTIIIPEVIFQEVLARHKDKLVEARDNARNKWENLHKWRVLKQEKFPEIDVERESKALEKRLHQPSPWVKSVRYHENPPIEAIDVALRGVNRIRPASNSGEQLRDVLLWLNVLQCAKNNDREVAFVSGDNEAFKGQKNESYFNDPQDKQALHPQLLKDCADYGVTVYFYRTVNEFVQAQALESSPLKDTRLLKELTFSSLEAKVVFHIANVNWKYGFASELQLNELHFSEGILYKISEEASLAELIYEGKTTLTFPAAMSAFQLGPSVLSPPIPSPRFFSNIGQSAHPLSAFGSVLEAPQPNIGGILTFGEPLSYGVASAQTVPAFKRVFEVHVKISARFVKGELIEWDVDSTTLNEIEKQE